MREQDPSMSKWVQAHLEEDAGGLLSRMVTATRAASADARADSSTRSLASKCARNCASSQLFPCAKK